jgi:hypothetical protein
MKELAYIEIKKLGKKHKATTYECDIIENNSVLVKFPALKRGRYYFDIVLIKDGEASIVNRGFIHAKSKEPEIQNI